MRKLILFLIIILLGGGCVNQKTTVKVFFPNIQKDPQMLDCSKVYPVEREIIKTPAIVQNSLEELLKGPTEEEKLLGYITSINDNVKIKSISVVDGLATVDFDEQFNFQMGGSCRVSSISAQVEETLKQFSNVNQVVISVNGQTEGILEP